MHSLRGRVVAITGAASGIGRALARAAAAQGAALALCDRDDAGLAETVAAVRAAGGTAQGRRVDVAHRAEVEAWARAVGDEHGCLHVLVNNAGVGLVATVEHLPEAELRRLFDVNFFGVVHGCQAFLPWLTRADAAHIVNVSSVFGLVGVAGQGAYCAAKFAVRGFSESLRLELELDHPHVGLTCVHPGGVRTAIARNASMPGRSSAERAEFLRRWERYARLEPSEVADAVLDAVLRRHPRVVLGSDARALDALQRFSPALTRRLVARLARRDEP